MKKSYLPRLADIIAEINYIEEEIQKLSYSEYKNNVTYKKATERSLLIISEASRHIPERLKMTQSQIDWRKIADVGNILRHEYHYVDDLTLWNIIENHIPPLKSAMENIMEIEKDD